ncbi:MAG: PepSY-associated TM helix domain-containing protein [Pseudomonadota bacterium]
MPAAFSERLGAVLARTGRRLSPFERRRDGSAPTAKPKTARKRLYALHTWLGFHLAAVTALVLATGTIATVSNEIDWLIQHDMRVTPDGEKVSWGEMEAALRAYRPGDAISSIASMRGDHFAYRATVYDEYGRRTYVHVDQWTGRVTGETHPLTVQRVFRDLHRYLYMPNFIGLPLVTSLAFVLAVSLYTGLKTARNWRTLLFRVRTDKGARILWGDAHKAAGLWGVWFFIVIIVTGVWYLVEFGAAVGGARIEPPRPRVSAERVEAFGPVIADRPLDEVVAAAQSAFPELRVTSVHYPSTAGHTFTVLGKVGNPLIRQRANRVFLDPVSLDVVTLQRSTEIGWAAYLNEMADPLHFGFFGGLPTKLIWFVFGVAMTGLSLTGVWLTWRRLKTASPSRAQFATLPVLAVSMYFCTIWYDRFQGPHAPADELVLADQSVTPRIRAAAKLEKGADGSPTGLVRILLEAEGGRPNVAEVVVSAGGETETVRVRLVGVRSEARASLPPAVLQAGETLNVRVTFNNALQATTSWSLPGSLSGSLPGAARSSG